MIKKIWRHLSLILLAGTIALVPSFNYGKFAGQKAIELRIEDFLLLIFVFFGIINFLIFRKDAIKKPPLFPQILFWLSIAFFSALVNWIIVNLPLDRGFFYFLKIIELFVLYFFVFFRLKRLESAKFILNFWLFLGVVNVGYVVYQAITGQRTGEYGAAALSEWGVFPTGSFFLILFVFFLNLFLYHYLNLKIGKLKKIILGIFAISPSIGVFGSASKTAFLGLIFAVVLTLLFLILKKRKFKFFFLAVVIIAAIFAIFIYALRNINLVFRVLPMFTSESIVSGYEAGRWIFIEKALQSAVVNPFAILLAFFGYGIGYITESHNQFFRNFIETGLIGSLAFFLLIFAILKYSYKGFSKSRDSFVQSQGAGLLVATLTMLFLSLAADPFVAVKPAETYWFFTAIAMSVLVLYKTSNNNENLNNSALLQ